MVIVESIVLAVGIVVGYVLYPLVHRTRRAFDRAFRDQVLQDASEWLADKLEASVPRVREALGKMAETGAADPLLEKLQRVECIIEKLGPTSAERTVAVTLRGEESVKVGKVTVQVDWADLPSEIRKGFIRRPDKAQCFVIVERKGTAGA